MSGSVRRLGTALLLPAIATITLCGCGGASGPTVHGTMAAAPRRTTGRPTRESPPSEANRLRLTADLERGVTAAAAEGGTAEAAAMLDGWRHPVIVTSEAKGKERFMRLWSMSKVATMIAVLRGLGWGRDQGRPITPELDAALHGAITRSENCRQRRVVLELQRLAGDPAAARRAFSAVFHDAGAGIKTATQIAPPESSCLEYLEAQTEIPEPLAPALLLGTSTWRIGDAVRLVHALSIDTYGAAISREVLGLMRLPKLPSREVAAGELTAPLDWGAGESLPPGTAYKAGWGGSLHGNFLAGQIAVTELPGIGRVALAAAFHPDAQPSEDDPGITRAPQALDAIFAAVARPGQAEAR
jgi:hypothetical protein